MKKILGAGIFAIMLFIIGVSSASATVFDIWAGTGSGGATCNVGGPCTFCDALKVISNIINSLMFIVFPLAILMIVYGAIRLMMAGGSDEAVKTGKDAVTNAVIGIVIALASWIIINEVLHILTGRADFPWNQIQCQEEAIHL